MFRTDLYIGGNWRSASDGGRFDVINPADETILASVASATETDALAAVDAAHSAMKNWAAKPPRERAEILRRSFDLMTARRDEFARIITLENGKARDLRRRVLPLVFRGGDASGRALDPRAGVRSAHSGSPETGRRRRARYAVELPGSDGDAQDRACIGGRLLCHRQARLRNANYHAGAHASS
jgi:acyl-CoA reductase-like NAD-dependent aldehyde dehydrogenase